jgi:hypothetical protein
VDAIKLRTFRIIHSMIQRIFFDPLATIIPIYNIPTSCSSSRSAGFPFSESSENLAIRSKRRRDYARVFPTKMIALSLTSLPTTISADFSRPIVEKRTRRSVITSVRPKMHGRPQTRQPTSQGEPAKPSPGKEEDAEGH